MPRWLSCWRRRRSREQGRQTLSRKISAWSITCASPSHPLPRQFARLLHPIRELRLVKHFVLSDVEVAHFLLLGLAGRKRPQRLAAEECDLDVLREAMDA